MECISYKKNNLLDINGYVLTKNQFLKLGKYKRRKTKTKKKANIDMYILPSMAVTHTSR